MTFDDAVERLRGALSLPLPGSAAQAVLAPTPARGWPAGFSPAGLRHAAGLLLIFPIERRAHLVLTVRSDVVRHSGQVSLPGGVVEPGETFEQAALREAHEEVGVEVDDVRTLGALTPVDIAVSGFRLHPIVASCEQRPRFVRADREVARILEVDLDALIDPANLTSRTLIREGQTLSAPTLLAGGAEIWGATAMVLAECLTLLGWTAPSRR